MSEGPAAAAEGRTEMRGRGLWEGWKREAMDPAEGEEEGGALSSLGDRGQGG